MPPKKDPYASPAEKLIGLFCLLLFTGRKYSLKQLATKFRCSKQTVLRMVEQVERSHVVTLKTEIVDGERYYWAKGRSVANVSFAPEEIQHLVLFRDIVAHLLPVPIQDEIKLTLLKAAALSETGLVPETGVTCDVHFKGRIDYSPFYGMLQNLIAASFEKRLCRLDYQPNQTRTAKSYLFAPVKLLAFRESLYAHGWLFREVTDNAPAHEITFAVQRLKKLTVLDDCHSVTEVPPEPKHFGIMDDERFRAKVKFQKEAAQYIQERVWSEDQVLTPYKNGNVDLEFSANSWAEVRSWILSFGGKAKVVFPKELREEVLAEAQAAVERNSD